MLGQSVEVQTYDAPISPLIQGPFSMTTSGSHSISIFGRGFGMYDYSAQAKIQHVDRYNIVFFASVGTTSWTAPEVSLTSTFLLLLVAEVAVGLPGGGGGAGGLIYVSGLPLHLARATL